jgi:phosphoserine phosphatase RsbU/P
MTETLFENAPSGFFAYDENATILVVNETMAFILEKTSEDIVGKSVETIFTLPTRIFFQTHFFPMVKMNGHAEEIFISLLSATGKHLPVLLNAKNMEWEGKLITCCSCILVPNRKKFEDELVAARQTAEKALQENTELLKAKSALQLQTEQFSHVVTHNLKEPLRKILMYTSRLMNETTAPSLAKLAKANEQMKAVIAGLQQYVWLNEKNNDYARLDLNLLMEELVAAVKKEFDLVKLVIEYNQLPNMEADRDQLQMMFRHLLLNAIKFRKEDAVHVTITATIVKQNHFRSVEDKYHYKDFARIEITDDGIGFDPMYAGEVFGLFKKLHYSEGQGLGLALCKKIAENHNGHIEAESELNKYTKITIWLPCFQSA